jgi:hypothetical protein
MGLILRLFCASRNCLAICHHRIGYEHWRLEAEVRGSDDETAAVARVCPGMQFE